MTHQSWNIDKFLAGKVFKEFCVPILLLNLYWASLCLFVSGKEVGSQVFEQFVPAEIRIIKNNEKGFCIQFSFWKMWTHFTCVLIPSYWELSWHRCSICAFLLWSFLLVRKGTQGNVKMKSWEVFVICSLEIRKKWGKHNPNSENLNILHVYQLSSCWWVFKIALLFLKFRFCSFSPI